MNFGKIGKKFVKNKIWVLFFLIGFIADVVGWLVESIAITYFA